MNAQKPISNREANTVVRATIHSAVIYNYREEMLRQNMIQRLAEMSVTYGRISPQELEQRRAALAQERAAGSSQAAPGLV